MGRLFAAAAIIMTMSAETKASPFICGQSQAKGYPVTISGPPPLKFTLIESSQVNLDAQTVCLSYAVINYSSDSVQAQPKFAWECYSGMTGTLISQGDPAKPKPGIAIIGPVQIAEKMIASYRDYHDACRRSHQFKVPISYAPR